MTNAERIEENNAELREAIEMAENLPDARIEKADVVEALGYEPASTAVATEQKNGLMSAADKKKLDTAVDYDEQYDFVELRASLIGAHDFADLYIGDTSEFVYISDGEGGYVDMQQLFYALREAGILSSTYGLRKTRNVEQTNEPSEK